MRPTRSRCALAAISVLLVVVLHEADATTELAGVSDRLAEVSDTEVQELGAPQEDSPSEVTKQANEEIAKAKDAERREEKKAEDSGLSPEAVADLDAQNAKVKEEAAEEAMQEAEQKSDEMPSTDSILTAVKGAVKETETEEEVGNIVPGDIKEIRAAMRKGMIREGVDEGMTKAEKEKLLAYETNRADAQAIAEVGVPPHIMDAILKDPEKAKKLYGQFGKLVQIAEPVNPGDGNGLSAKLNKQLQIRRSETLEQYFIRLLKFKGDQIGLTFDDPQTGHDWLMRTAGNLVRNEKGMGWESSIRKAATMVAQARVEQIVARVEVARTRLTKARTSLAKEIEKKAEAGKMAQQYNALKKSAEKKAREVENDKALFREWSKKGNELELRIDELKTEEKAADKDMGKAMEKASEAEKSDDKAQKQAGAAEKAQKAAAVRVREAKAALLDAHTEEGIDAAKAELKSAEAVAANTVKTAAKDAEGIRKAEGAQQVESSAVLLDKTKVQALKDEEGKKKEQLAKASEFKRMYETKGKTAKTLNSNGGKRAQEMEKAFVQAVLNAVRQPMMIKIKSATYICPNQLNPKTKQPIPDENVIAEMDGNQNANLRKACDGYTNCDYMVDPAVIGEASKGCKDYSYSVKYTCVQGLPKKFGPRQVIPGSEPAKGDKSAAASSAVSLIQLDPDVKEAEEESGATKAQEDTEELNNDMDSLEADLEEENPIKKKDDAASMAGENTEQVVKEAENELKDAGLAGKGKKKGPQEQPAKEMFAALSAGPGRRMLKMECEQPQDPIIAQKEEVVKAAKAELAEAKARLNKDATQEEDKIQDAVAKDKADAAAAKEKARREQDEIAEDEQKIKELQMQVKKLEDSLKTETNDDTKEKYQQQLEPLTTDLTKLKEKVASAQTAREKAIATSRVAAEKMEAEKEKYQDTTHTEMHTPLEFQSAQTAVIAARKRVKETLTMTEHVMNDLSSQTEPYGIFSNIEQLHKLMKQKVQYEKLYQNAKRHRDEITLDVSQKSQQEHKDQVVKDQKKLVTSADEVAAIKLELAKTQSASDRSQLEAKLAKAQAAQKEAKKEALKDEFMPAIQETTIVTKLEKQGLVKERQKSLQRKEENLKLTEEELHVALQSLKQATDPDIIMKLTTQIGSLKREIGGEQKSVQRKEKNLMKAQHIDAKPGVALVDQLDGSVADAKAKLQQQQAKVEQLQSEIDMSDDPLEVKKYVAQLDVAKKEIASLKQAVVRRQTRVDKVEKVVDMESGDEDKKKPVDRMAKLEMSSEQLAAEQAKLDALKGKLQEANADFAGAINTVLRHKENKMKHAVGTEQKKLAKLEVQLDSAKADFKKAKQVMEFEGKTAHMFQRIQDAILGGEYSKAAKVHEVHKKTKDTSKFVRTDGQVAQDRMELSVPNPNMGVCANGSCCLRSYKDPICADERSNICQTVSEADIADWKELIAFPAVVERSKNGKTLKALNTTMHVKAMWTRSERGEVSLEAQVCGKYTKLGSDGVNVCFPQEADGSAKGIPIGKLLGAKAGSCVRTSDFVSVIREKLAVEVAKGMDLLNKLEKAKPDGAAGKPRQIDSITEAVSRAIGGAFKGAMGGVSREVEDSRELKESMLNFLQYAVTQDWEDLLQMDGSFMVTQDPGGAGSGSGSGSPPKQIRELLA